MHTHTWVAVQAVDPKKTAVLFIEYQNEFTTEGGKMHDAVKATMGDMLDKSAAVAEKARAAGATVFHAPIMVRTRPEPTQRLASSKRGTGAATVSSKRTHRTTPTKPWASWLAAPMASSSQRARGTPSSARR